MTAPALLALLGSLAGAPGPAAAQPAPAYAAVPQPKDWMRLYPMRQYGAFWHLQLSVPGKKYAKARARALKILEDAGARHTVPVENAVSDERGRYQQFSVEADRARGGAALERLKKLGRVDRLTRTENPLPEVEREVPSKLARLRGEDCCGGAPASRAALDEIAGHLEAVQAAYESSRDRVLFHIVMAGEP